jgi:hypothetical protein
MTSLDGVLPGRSASRTTASAACVCDRSDATSVAEFAMDADGNYIYLNPHLLANAAVCRGPHECGTTGAAHPAPGSRRAGRRGRPGRKTDRKLAAVRLVDIHPSQGYALPDRQTAGASPRLFPQTGG